MWGEIHEYNLENKSVKLTEYKDFYFSPDGKYYYQDYYPMAEKDFEVYDIKTNKKVELNAELNNLSDELNDGGNNIIDWDYNSSHNLKYINVNKEYETPMTSKF
jgi:hypothetical protein